MDKTNPLKMDKCILEFGRLRVKMLINTTEDFILERKTDSHRPMNTDILLNLNISS